MHGVCILAKPLIATQKFSQIMCLLRPFTIIYDHVYNSAFEIRSFLMQHVAGSISQGVAQIRDELGIQHRCASLTGQVDIKARFLVDKQLEKRGAGKTLQPMSEVHPNEELSCIASHRAILAGSLVPIPAFNGSRSNSRPHGEAL